MKNQLKVLNKKESSLRALLSFFTEPEINDEDTNPFNYYRSISENNEDLETINILEKSYKEISKIEDEFFGEAKIKQAQKNKFGKSLKSANKSEVKKETEVKELSEDNERSL